MKEIWKDIKGYEGYYQVSNLGNVRSVERIVDYSDGIKRLRKGSILKAEKNRNGYLRITLSKSSKVKKMMIHRLVAQAFIPNPSNLPEINHKDEVKTNNRVGNLEWCSHLYNSRYGTRLKKLSKTVIQLDLETKQIIAEYHSAREAGRYINGSQGNISSCCRGKLKTAYGYKWEYKKE